MHVRKLFTAIEESFSEMGREANEPLKKVAVVAVVKNPLAGSGYGEDPARTPHTIRINEYIHARCSVPSWSQEISFHQ